MATANMCIHTYVTTTIHVVSLKSYYINVMHGKTLQRVTVELCMYVSVKGVIAVSILSYHHSVLFSCSGVIYHYVMQCAKTTAVQLPTSSMK